MPQLDMLEWFLYFLYTWLLFLLLSPSKISSHINFNDPKSPLSKTTNFSWPQLW